MGGFSERVFSLIFVGLFCKPIAAYYSIGTYPWSRQRRSLVPRASAENEGNFDTSSLSARIDELRASEMKKQTNTARNWRNAMWTNRGFVLGGADVTQVAFEQSTGALAVGTADGMVYVVGLGTERLAEFRRAGDNNGGGVTNQVDNFGGGGGRGGEEAGSDSAAFERFRNKEASGGSPRTTSFTGGELQPPPLPSFFPGDGVPTKEKQQRQQPLPLVRGDDGYENDDDDEGKAGEEVTPFVILAEYGGPGGVHLGEVTSLAWDGGVLLSGGADGTVAVWRHGTTSPEGLAAAAAAAAASSSSSASSSTTNSTFSPPVKSAAAAAAAAAVEDDGLSELRALMRQHAEAESKAQKEAAALFDAKIESVEGSPLSPPPSPQQALAPRHVDPLHLFRLSPASEAGSEGEVDSSAVVGLAVLQAGRRLKGRCLVAAVSSRGGIQVLDAVTGVQAGPPLLVPNGETEDRVASATATTASNGDVGGGGTVETRRMGAAAVTSVATVEGPSSSGGGEASGTDSSSSLLLVGTREGRVVCFEASQLVYPALRESVFRGGGESNSTTASTAATNGEEIASDTPPPSPPAPSPRLSFAPPLYSFRAHDGSKGGVTSLFTGPRSGPGGSGSGGVGGEDFLAVLDPSLKGACVVLTGGGDGAVRQWEVFAETRPQQQQQQQQAPLGGDDRDYVVGGGGGDSVGDLKVRHFPQLANQKLRRRVHAIPNAHGAAAAVTCVSADNARILSASGPAGSVRCWSRTNGDLLFEMSGFNPQGLRSLALGSSLLACDGMGSTVCLHDFAEIDGDDFEGYLNGASTLAS